MLGKVREPSTNPRECLDGVSRKVVGKEIGGDIG